MADINRALSLRKNLQKHAGRARELFRQNLGKADRTTDEGFDEYVKNFNTQQCAATRLSKEVKNYNNCVKALQAASKSLMEVVCELYEESWIDHDKVQVKAELLDKKWEDFHTTVDDQVVKPLVAYSEQFTDVNNKILKRRRKLLDYDCCRHTIQNLEQHSAKERKKEEARLNKAKEQLAEKQSLYETINSELMDELPALWDSRVAFLASNFQCLFIAEATFHNQSFKLFNDLNDVVELLARENQKGVYAIKRFPGGECNPEKPLVGEPHAPTQGNGEGESSSSEYLSTETLICSDSENVGAKDSCPKPGEPEAVAKEETDTKGSASPATPQAEEPKATKGPIIYSFEEEEELPPGALNKVRAVFQYTAEDADELSFEPGDIIYVTEFDDPEQQEDGWLMGYKQGTDVKGLFPANFTRPIWRPLVPREAKEVGTS